MSYNCLALNVQGSCNQDACEVPVEINTHCSESFQVFLAENLRKLEEALVTWHRKEMGSFSTTASKFTKSANQDTTEPVHVKQEASNQDKGSAHLLHEDEQTTRDFKTPAITSVEDTVKELACAPSNLARVDEMQDQGLPHLTRGKSGSSQTVDQPNKNHSEIKLELHSMFGSRTPESGDFMPHDSSASHSLVCSLESGQTRVGDVIRDESSMKCLSCLVTHPLTARRLVHDMTIFALIWYDVLVVPLEFSGLLDPHTWLDVVMACAWTVDLVLGFFRGFQRYGVIDLRLRSTAREYIKSTFLVDCTLVILDWSFLLLTHLTNFGGILRGSKTFRFWRAIRLLKFLRWYRMTRIHQSTKVFVQSDLARTTHTTFSWIIVLLVLSHLIACFWFLLGKVSEGTPSWVLVAKELYMQQSHGEEPGNWYFYVTALHWAVTQFTPASMEVTPKNLWERLYTLAVILIALVLFPTFLSSITNSVSAFRKQSSDFREANRYLSQYLLDNRISLDLSTRIQSVVFAQYKNQRKAKRVHETDVSLLKLLPPSLKEQMHTQLFQPMIIRHPILNALAASHERTLTKICDRAMSQKSLGSAEELFAYGKEAEHMYFVVSGSLLYFEGPLPSPGIREEVSAGEWFCDQVLWVPWTHCGQMTGLQPCELANLDSASFLKIVDKHGMVREMCRRFAESYLLAITEDLQEGWCNDLGCSMEKLDGIVSTVATPSFRSWRSSLD